MLNIRKSEAPAPSAAFDESKRSGREDNIAWLGRHVGEGDGVRLLLVGGTDRQHFRLRIAQSQLRDDLSPSSWSHVALVETPADDLAKTTLREISLTPRDGFGFPPPTNGVQQGTLAAYRSRRDFPNLALLHVPVAAEDVRATLERFQGQRTILDATELIIVWLAYLWGAGRAANPLLEANGIPSAAMVEMVVGAAGYELTPGLESRASCPEAIWQAARWWHRYYEGVNAEPIRGAWNVEHRL
jgi:hypothetical protein